MNRLQLTFKQQKKEERAEALRPLLGSHFHAIVITFFASNACIRHLAGFSIFTSGGSLSTTSRSL